SSSRSSTPQVNAPWAPPPWSARLTRFTSVIAGLDLREIDTERIFFGCESIGSPADRLAAFLRVASVPALESDAPAAAADRQLPVGGLIQGFQLQVRRQQREIVGKLRSPRLVVADRRLPRQAGGLDGAARSIRHVDGGCL